MMISWLIKKTKIQFCPNCRKTVEAKEFRSSSENLNALNEFWNDCH